MWDNASTTGTLPSLWPIAKYLPLVLSCLGATGRLPDYWECIWVSPPSWLVAWRAVWKLEVLGSFQTYKPVLRVFITTRAAFGICIWHLASYLLLLWSWRTRVTYYVSTFTGRPTALPGTQHRHIIAKDLPVIRGTSEASYAYNGLVLLYVVGRL